VDWDFIVRGKRDTAAEVAAGAPGELVTKVPPKCPFFPKKSIERRFTARKIVKGRHAEKKAPNATIDDP
jgi:hypothetical protein